ncbi:MAG: polyprenyl synthetase family protein [Acidobacteria bacterium]|nr:polyprenyl synthetase family protein [Acidobacteriota bacterium]
MVLTTRLAKHRARLNQHLRRLLPPAQEAPRTLHRAMRYSVLGGGKRIRPILCLEAAAVFRRPPAGIAELACAIEFIHTYSLIHDDLPALDNDDLRRGRPTCHKKFGEATAILAGDALLTLAFEVLARMRRPAPGPHAAIIRELAAAVGTRGGMIAGQMADLEAEGRRVSARQLETIHRGKTGALIRASVRTGALFAGADKPSLQRLSRFGAKLGLAFQIVDDVLDVRSSTRRLGKTTHKDAALGKATYPAVHGLEKSQRMAGKLVEEACDELKPFGRRADTLREIARYLLTRAA